MATSSIGSAVTGAGSGTVSCSAVEDVVGVGTAFLTELSAPGTVAIDGYVYSIKSIDDDTNLVLETGSRPSFAFPNVSAVGYSIGGRDYATPQQWMDDCPADLTTAMEIWRGECYADSEFRYEVSGDRLTSLVTITGTVTSASYYVELTAAAGESFADHADAATNPLIYSSSYGAAFYRKLNYKDAVTVSENYTRISRLQIYSRSGSGVKRSAIQVASGVGDTQMRELVLDGGMVVKAGSNHKFTNIMILGGFYSQVMNSGQIVNVTCIQDGTAGTGKGFGSGFTNYSRPNIDLINCCTFGFDIGFNSGFNSTNNSNNASDSGDAPGTNSLDLTGSWADQFVAIDGTDWRVKAGSDLAGAGAPQSAQTNDLDIIGQARSTSAPFIGCWEYIAAGITRALALATVAAVTQSETAEANASLTITADAALSQAETLSAPRAAALTSDTAAQQAATTGVLRAAALAAVSALAQSESTDTTGATTLAAVASIVAAGGQTHTASSDLASNAAITAANSITLDVSEAMASAAAFTASVSAIYTEAATLAAVVDVVQAVTLEALATSELATDTQILPIAPRGFAGAITLTASATVSASGFIVDLTIATPDGRTLYIASDDRSLTVAADDRTVTISA